MASVVVAVADILGRQAAVAFVLKLLELAGVGEVGVPDDLMVSQVQVATSLPAAWLAVVAAYPAVLRLSAS